MKATGIGPILAMIGGTSLILIFVAQVFTGFQIQVQSPWREALFVLGVLLAMVGVFFYISSAIRVMRAFGSHQLETKGVYRFTRNPLYAALIVFIIPALAFLLNNLVVLIASVIVFVAFKFHIHKEENYLLKEFGQAYQQYEKEVPQLIPFVRI
jgi:protein-S-isoprenylcysteine O-methyltransferase Ste14